MNLHEFQAKQLLAEAGVPVDRGIVAAIPLDARRAAERISAARWVVKAQIHSGGRGKAGGVRLADSPDEVEKIARELLGTRLVTEQTGPGGSLVRFVLVSEAVAIAGESYLAALVDRASRRPVVVAGAEGGMQIEHLAQAAPRKILRTTIDPAIGLRPFQVRRIARHLALQPGPAAVLPAVIEGILRILTERDASLVEINPLACTVDGRLLALDAKVVIDDNALFRHPDLAALRDPGQEDPKETAAARHRLSYIRLDGTIGCMVNGAGLAMATMDIIQLHGGRPANFLDVGGDATVERVTEAFRILASDTNVRAVLINIFGGIVKCDVIAEGILKALDAVEVAAPVIVRLEGTRADIGRRMLAASGRALVPAAGMQEAARKAVEAARKAVEAAAHE